MAERSAVPERLAHQPALDGLRGLAVLAVLAWHDVKDRDPNGWLSGGFLGVDVFFVLSGFLITSLLLIDHAHRGTTVSRRFWARRARRLLPALFVLLVGVAAYAALVAPKAQLDDIRGEAFATLLYVQNWYSIVTRSLPSTPLSHTWSLSIEEQWYLLWPLLLAALLWFARGRTTRVLVAIGALAACSAVLMAVLYVPRDHSRVYSGTDTRAQALLVGAVLAVLLLRRRGPVRRGARIALEAVGVAGLVFLAWMLGAVTPDDAWLYRGGFLLVAVASALVIGAAVHEHSPVLGRTLSLVPLTAIGLISYGLYLYHWPVYLWLSPSRAGLHGDALLALRFAVTFAAAIASYFIVEMPIRRGALHGRRLAIAIPTALTTVVVLLVVATVGATRGPTSATVVIAYRKLALSVPTNLTKVLVAGDVGAYNLGRGVDGSFVGGGIHGATAATLGCGIAGGRVIIGRKVAPETPCARWTDTYRRAVEGFEPDVSVLMVGSGEVFDRMVDGKQLRVGSSELAQYLHAQLDRARELLTARGAPLLLLTVPCMDPPAGGLNTIRRDGARVAWLNAVWRDFAAEHHPNVIVGDYGRFLCPDGVSSAIVGGKSLRPDGINLSRAGAIATWRWLAPITRRAPRG